MTIKLQDFWFAVLHKKLAGNRVLTVRSRTLEKTKSSLYSHCTPVDDEQNYAPGAVTVIGINLGDVELIGNVSDGSDSKTETILHEYLLTGNTEGK